MSSVTYPLPDVHRSASRFSQACSEAVPRPRLVHSSSDRGERTFSRDSERLLMADRSAIALAQSLNEIDPWLAAAAFTYKNVEAWQRRGFARLEDHCREFFGRSGRWLRDLAALGASIRQEPRLGAALTGADGGTPLGRCRATLIARVANGETLAAWVALANRVSVIELKRRIREARAAGSSSPIDDSSCRTSSMDGGPPSLPLVSDEEPDTETRCRLALPVPLPVAAAFEEGLELFRAVEGSDATVTSFVEALSAEQAAAGSVPAERVDRSSLSGGESQRIVEQRLAARTQLWSFLPRMGEEPSAFARPGVDASWTAARQEEAESRTHAHTPDREAGSATAEAAASRALAPAVLLSAAALERFERIRCPASEPDDPVLRIASLVDLEDEVERRLGELLLTMGEAQAWSRLGFSGIGHYAEQRLGVSRSWAEDRVRAARALRRHARLRAAYEASRIGLEALLKVSRLLDDSKEPERIVEAWVRQATECTVKRLRDEARELLRRRAGADDGGHDTMGVARARAADDLSPARGRSTTGRRELLSLAPLTDDAWFRSLRRRAGMARIRIERLANLALARAVADTALTLKLPDDVADLFVRSLAAATCRTFSTTGGVTPLWSGLLVMLEDFAKTWDHDELDPKRPPRVREVLIAFGWRCAAPGCTSRRHLQVHHVIYRSRGGSDEGENLVVLCLFHHLRGEHGDLAWCRGQAPLGIVWRLGAKETAEWYRNERRVKRVW